MTSSNFLFFPTLKLNLLRSFFSGVVFSLFYLSGIMEEQPPASIIILTPLIMPILTLTFWLLAYILRIVSLGGIGNILVLLTTIWGDPILYIIFKLKPEWSPVDKFNFINFAGLIYIYKDVSLVQENIEIENESNDDCPFIGTITSNKHTTALGLDAPMFKITKDWKVSTSDGKDFGWIDRDGRIHKGPTVTGVNPDEFIMFNDEITGELHSDKFYINNEFVGRHSKQ